MLPHFRLSGEWYIDRKTSKMYYYPEKPLKEGDVFEVASFIGTVIDMKYASNINFQDIEICKIAGNNYERDEYRASNKQSSAFYMHCVDNIKLDGLKIHDIMQYGICVRGDNVTIENCEIYDIGYVGIKTSGSGDVNTLREGNIVIKNNHLSGPFSYYMSINNAGAIKVSGTNETLNSGTGEGTIDVGVQIINNVIHNNSDDSIFHDGLATKIKYNEIFNTVNRASDAGAIYCGRNWGLAGSEIMYNFIHDIGQQYNIHAAAAFYTDDCANFQTIKNNIVVANNKYEAYGPFFNGGKENVVEGNTFVNQFREIYFIKYLRNRSDGSGWGDYQVHIKAMNTRPFESRIYVDMYPEMKKNYDEWINDRIYDGNVTMVDNFSYNCDGTRGTPTTYEGNVAVEEDVSESEIFVDAENRDYRVKLSAKEKYNIADSVLDENFDIDLIGIQTDYTVDAERMQFDMLYPENGRSDIAPNRIDLAWQTSEFADWYFYEIATDPEMKNIVKQGKTIERAVTVDGLERNKTYYWRVSAELASRQFGKIIPAESGIWSFTLGGVSKVDTYPLIEGYEKLEKVVSGVTSDGNAGSVDKALYDSAVKTLEEAKKMAMTDIYDPAPMNNIIEEMNSLISEIRLNQKMGISTLNITPDSKFYSTDGGAKVTAEEGRAIINAPNISSSRANVVLEDMLPTYNTVKFRFKYTGGNDSWFGLGIRQQDKTTMAYSDPCYYMIVKKDIIEYQGQSVIFETSENNGKIAPDTWYDVEFTAKDTDKGAYILFKINNEVVFEYIDEKCTEADQGMFNIMIPQGMTIEIEDVEVSEEDALNLGEVVEKYRKNQ